MQKKEEKKEENKNSVEWHALSEEESLKELKSSKEGLSIEEAKKRLEVYGKNELKEVHKIRPLLIFFSQFNSFFIYLLILAAAISLLVAHLLDFCAITAIIILNAFLGFIQNYKAEKTIYQLKKTLVPKAKVLRNNVLYETSAIEIVPGDILIVQEGDKIVADARVVESHELQCNEAVLTGESSPVDKLAKKINVETILAERQNMLYSGTSVVRGSGKAVVVATGMNTEFGKIANLVQKTKAEKTPLQARLDRFTVKLGLIVIAMTVLVAVAGFIAGLDKLQVFLTSISLAVSAVPEGLPAVITICLAFAVQRMYKFNSLIRTLPSAETLGNVTVICADKTGTMTEEKMTVVALYYDTQLVKADNLCRTKEKALEMLLKINCLCNNSRIEKTNSTERIIGDPTEAALLQIASKAGFDKKMLTEQETRVKEFAFTSARKMMSIVRQNNDEIVSYVKGAPDTILERCSKELLMNNELRLTATRKKELIKVYEEMASNGLRVLAFAYKNLGKTGERDAQKITQKDAETELVFVGFQGMLDPPRPEVKAAIQACQEAGISVKMITGDSLLTAKAVALQIGLKGRAIEGKELEKLNDTELSEQVKDISIFARTTPEQKLKIVNILKEKKEVVAVTGDGVNDAPALKRADIGVAMGIRGSEVARETSNIVLLDDNFASIVKAIQEGRIVYDNIKKFTKFLLGVNFSEIFLILYSILLALPLPLLPLHILWMNLITDSIPALALSVEKGEDVMKRKPIKEKDILKGMLLFIIVAGVLAFIVYLLAFHYSLSYFELDKTRTIVLTTSILFQMFFVFACRSNKPLYKIGVFSNKWLVWAVLASVLLHVLFMYTPLNSLLYLVPLGLKDWLIVLGFGVSGLLVFEIGKNIKSKQTIKK